jgi:hypothetical protein
MGFVTAWIHGYEGVMARRREMRGKGNEWGAQRPGHAALGDADGAGLERRAQRKHLTFPL